MGRHREGRADPAGRVYPHRRRGSLIIAAVETGLVFCVCWADEEDGSQAQSKKRRRVSSEMVDCEIFQEEPSTWSALELSSQRSQRRKYTAVLYTKNPVECLLWLG